MKKNILVKVGERTETRERIIPAAYDENGKIVTAETVETYEITVPIMEARTVDITQEEIEETERLQVEMPRHDPTPEERLENIGHRINALETTTDDMILLMAELIGG